MEDAKWTDYPSLLAGVKDTARVDALEYAACATQCGRWNDAASVYMHKSTDPSEALLLTLSHADFLKRQNLELEGLEVLESFLNNQNDHVTSKATEILLKLMLADVKFWAHGITSGAARALEDARLHFETRTNAMLTDIELRCIFMYYGLVNNMAGVSNELAGAVFTISSHYHGDRVAELSDLCKQLQTQRRWKFALNVMQLVIFHATLSTDSQAAIQAGLSMCTAIENTATQPTMFRRVVLMQQLAEYLPARAEELSEEGTASLTSLTPNSYSDWQNFYPGLARKARTDLILKSNLDYLKKLHQLRELEYEASVTNDFRTLNLSLLARLQVLNKCLVDHSDSKKLHVVLPMVFQTLKKFIDFHKTTTGSACFYAAGSADHLHRLMVYRKAYADVLVFGEEFERLHPNFDLPSILQRIYGLAQISAAACGQHAQEDKFRKKCMLMSVQRPFKDEPSELADYSMLCDEEMNRSHRWSPYPKILAKPGDSDIRADTSIEVPGVQIEEPPSTDTLESILAHSSLVDYLHRHRGYQVKGEFQGEILIDLGEDSNYLSRTESPKIVADFDGAYPTKMPNELQLGHGFTCKRTTFDDMQACQSPQSDELALLECARSAAILNTGLLDLNVAAEVRMTAFFALPDDSHVTQLCSISVDHVSSILTHLLKWVRPWVQGFQERCSSFRDGLEGEISLDEENDMELDEELKLDEDLWEWVEYPRGLDEELFDSASASTTDACERLWDAMNLQGSQSFVPRAQPSSQSSGHGVRPSDIWLYTLDILDIIFLSHFSGHTLDFHLHLGWKPEQDARFPRKPARWATDLPILRRRSLTCLSEMIDDQTVWMFCWPQSAGDLPKSTKYDVLCTAEDFASLWGPVYGVEPQGDGKYESLRVPSGFLLPWMSDGKLKHGERYCHWVPELSWLNKRYVRQESADQAEDDGTGQSQQKSQIRGLDDPKTNLDLDLEKPVIEALSKDDWAQLLNSVDDG